MEQFIDTNGLAVAVAVTVQAFLVLFWIISPLMGFIMWKGIRRGPIFVLILMLSLLAFNVLFVGLTYLLKQQMADTPAGILAVTLTALIVIPFSAYAIWLNRDTDTGLQREIKYLNQEHIAASPFEEKRRERLKKKRRD